MRTYSVNEMFYSLQGEGVRAGTPNVFIRFAGCNLRCVKAVHGFDCDTDFQHGEMMTAEEVVERAEELDGNDCRAVVFTGGEPGLQLDNELVAAFDGWFMAVETNGMYPLPDGIEWICCSPKPPDDQQLVVDWVDELKYVRRHGQELPDELPVRANHLLVSPAFGADGHCDQSDLDWCISLVLGDPRWRLSVQQHKGWGVR